ncbi:cytochrome bd-I oxidase subunit CydX [Xanthomonas sacchari]|nr:cytochrome bd-I oxidase subunit CydX [Xanthomonas campestris pv. cannae]
MWYFAWILGVGLASTAAILNGMWFEARERNAADAAEAAAAGD